MFNAYSCSTTLSSTPSMQDVCFKYHGVLRQVCEDDKGVVVIILWTQEQRKERALASSLSIIDSFNVLDEDNGYELGVSVGVASGTCWFGNIGNRSRREYAAIGDTAVLAARLMGHGMKVSGVVDCVWAKE